ncbi:hypothetical protein F511_21052 [Dorcoceras hygrometricum]|uniref:Uncharacterized protein n=1 Tax=Dorcoceras hygrometricum TaxID=472368 RepID=A0A2Z7CZN3_9LAMI|nr:hypothetical protein F511_21052 [Dorcoceras hygrometricum]
MDFRNMKRRELQVLCRKNKIPANLSNLEMASKLTQIFQRGQMTIKLELESNGVLHREAKKVRFSPDQELIEFTRSREKKRRSKRISSLCDNSLSVENVDKAGSKNGNVDCSILVTELREKISGNSVLNRQKRGRNKVDDSKSVHSVGIERISEQILDVPGRVTRSRGKKLVESLVREKSRGDDHQIVVGGTRRSLRNRGAVDVGKLDRDSSVTVKNNEKRGEQILADTVIAEENVVAHHNLSRRSKKKYKIVEFSEVCEHDIEKHAKDSSMCLIDATKSLAVKGLEVEVESNRAKIDLHGEIEEDSPVDEPMTTELRRSGRRKLEISSHDEPGMHNFTVVKDRYSSKISLLTSESSGVFENDEDIQIAGVRTRSRDKNLSQKAVTNNGRLLTDTKAHNSETTQQLTEPARHEKLKIPCKNPSKNKSLEVINELSEDVVIQPKIQARKRTRDHISRESFVKPTIDTKPLTRSKRKTQGKEKAVSAGVADNFGDQIKLSNSLKEPNSLEDESHNELLENEELLCAEVKLSMPNDEEGCNDANAKYSTCNKRLASIRQHHGKDKETSSAVDAGMNSIYVSKSIDMAEDPAPKISNSPSDSSQTEIGISSSKLTDTEVVPLLLKAAEHEVVKKTMPGDNNSKPVLQVFGQSETFGNEITAAELEVTEVAKADDTVQSSSPVLDHSQMKDNSAEEDLQTFEPLDKTNLLTGVLVEGQNHTEKSSTLEMGQKMGEAEGPINFTDSTSALEIQNSLSGKQRTSHESDDMTEGANFVFSYGTHKSDEASESSDLKDLKLTSDGQLEFGVSSPFYGERSAKTNLQDGEMCSEYFINCTGSASALELKEPSPGKLRIYHEPDNMTEEANSLVPNDTHSESVEAGVSRSIKDLKLTRDENIEYGVSTPFHGKRSATTNSQDSEMCSEYFMKDPDKDEVFHDPSVVVQASMPANPTGNERGRTPEVCQVGEGCKTSVHNHSHSELAEIEEGRCLNDHLRVTDEDRSSISAQFDCQKGDGIMPQDCISCSGEYSIDEFGGQRKFHDSQDAASAATPLKCIGSHATTFAKCLGEEEAGVSNTIGEKEANRSGTEINGDVNSLISQINNGEYKIFNQASESSNEAKYDPEQLKRPLSEPIATPTASTWQEALSSGSETAGDTKAIMKTDSKAEVSNQQVDENARCAERKKEKDDFADAQTLDVPMSMGGATNEVNFENQEIGLGSFLGSPVHKVIPSGPKEARTDKTNVIMSLRKSTAYQCHGNFNEMNQEMEEVGEREDHIPADKSSTCPTTSKHEYDTGSYVGNEGYQLQFLFATPIKSVASCMVDETSVCEKNAEKAHLSFMKCYGSMKENEMTKTNSDEKVEISGNELENYFGLENSILANGKDIRNPGTNNDVGVENTCSYAIISKTIYDANEESWTENIGEKMREPNALTKENPVVIENEEENKDVAFKVSKTDPSTTLSEAKSDGTEEQRTEKRNERMHESNSIFEKDEAAIRVERANDVEMENNISSTVLSEATLYCTEKHGIDNTGECMKKSNSVTEEIEEATMNEEVTEIESFELENIFSSAVFSEAKYDAYEEQCTENKGENMIESNSATEKRREENIFSLGQPLFVEEVTDNDSKLSEENIISPSLKNLRAGEGSAEILLHSNLSEDSRYGYTDYVKHEGEITRSSGDAPGITDYDIKQSNIEEDSHCLIEQHKDTIFSGEMSVDSFEKNLNPEVANMVSFNGETNLAMHKESPPCILSKASENDKFIDNEDKEMASSKIHFDGYALDSNMPSTNDGIQKTCEERALRHLSVHNMVTTAERISFCGGEFDMPQSLATHLFDKAVEGVNTGKTKMKTSNFNMTGNQEVDGGGVPQQFLMSESHPEEDLKTDTGTVSDSSTHDCSNEISTESHLANTMKGCLESYSVAVLSDSGANLQNDSDEPQRVTDERVAYFDDKDNKPSIGIGIESEKPEKSILSVESDDGSAMNDTLAGQKEIHINDGQCSAAAKKNARTILIHATPNKLFLTDMKENALDTKKSQAGDYTTVRPTKRRALQDVRWK